MKTYITLTELDSLISSKFLFINPERSDLIQQAQGEYVIAIKFFNTPMLCRGYMLILLENVEILEIPEAEYHHVFSNISFPAGRIKISKRKTSRDRKINQISAFSNEEQEILNPIKYLRYRRGVKALIDRELNKQVDRDSDSFDITQLTFEPFLQPNPMRSFVESLMAVSSIPELPKKNAIPNQIADRARWWVFQVNEFVKSGMFSEELLGDIVEGFKKRNYNPLRKSSQRSEIQDMLFGYYLFSIDGLLELEQDNDKGYQLNESEEKWRIFFKGMFDQSFDNRYYIDSVNSCQLHALEFVINKLINESFNPDEQKTSSEMVILKRSIIPEHFRLATGIAKETEILDFSEAINKVNWFEPHELTGLIMPMDSFNKDFYKGSKWYHRSSKVIVEEGTLERERFVIPPEEYELAQISRCKGWSGKKLGSFFKGFKFGLIIIKEGNITGFIRMFSYWMELSKDIIPNLVLINLVNDLEAMPGIQRDLYKQQLQDELSNLFPNTEIDLFFKSTSSNKREAIRILKEPIQRFGLKKTIVVADRRAKMVDEWVLESTNEFILDGNIEDRLYV